MLTLWCASAAICQDDDPDTSPPPLKLIPRDEKQQLTGQSDFKGRTKMSLSFMENHLAAAERLSAAGDSTGVFRELGTFEALMDDSLTYLQKNDNGGEKTLDAFRKLEIGLRPFMPRLEGVRRELPLGCDEYVRNLMHSLRSARAKAIDPLFSDNVVRGKNDE